ncbi:MAG TPA: conjugal transfer protein [Solirubrobacterales bacterium]|nr:conjugal transfer protein [Solirubrobacterales bacterium]
MRQEVSTKARASDSSVRSALRGVGRVAIWVVLGLLLVRGVLAEPSASTPVPGRSAEATDPRSAAFAVRFARTYLADPSAAALAPFLAEGVRVANGTPPATGTPAVAQAEVSDVRELGGGRSVLTVACELRDARTLYLAVPIVRKEAGEVAALGAPSIVAAPAAAGVDSNERPQPLAGGDATAIAELVEKFLPEYLVASEGGALSYLLAPGAVVVPLGGALQLEASTGIKQLGSGEGPNRTVLAAARVSDPASGAIYPVVYRLELVKGGGRWYVAAIEGASA